MPSDRRACHGQRRLFFSDTVVEFAAKWTFRNDPGLKLPYQDNISALLHEPSFRRGVGEVVFADAILCCAGMKAAYAGPLW